MKKIILGVCLSIPTFFFAQEVDKNESSIANGLIWGTESHVIPCSNFTITPPLRDLMQKEIEEDKEGNVTYEHEDKRDMPVQTFKYNVEDDGPAYGNEPSIIQSEFGEKNVGDKVILQNWIGQSASGFRPFDPTGAPGPNHYLQAINGDKYRIWSKTGQLLGAGTISSLFPSGNGDGDPIVLYDKDADRWFMSQFAGGGGGNGIYIAISQTADPLGPWYSYEFNSPDFPDYLKFSAWQDGYYMTANFSQKVFAFNRAKMLAGDASAEAVYQSFNPASGGGFFVPMPADASDGTMPGDGTPCPIFTYTDNGWGGGNIDAVKIYNASVTWNGASSNLQVALAETLPTDAFNASYDPWWNDIPQKGTSQKLDGIGGIIWFRAQWKSFSGYNAAVLNWGVRISATQRGIFWCELRQDQGTGAWSIYQQGIYAPGTDSYWLSGIAMNDFGDIALAYAKSGTNTYMSLGYTGRHATDPLGTMPLGEGIAFHGSGSQTGFNRVGDYAQLCIDPNGHNFWYTGEYMGSNGNARTRVYSFNLLGPLGVQEQNALEDVSLFPSPNNGMFEVDGLDEGSVYNVVDVNGRLIYSDVVNGSSIKVALSNVKPGVYFFRATKNSKEGRIKFVVTK